MANRNRKSKCGHLGLRWVIGLLLAILLLPLLPYLFIEAQAGLEVPNPGSELWRDVRQRGRSVTGNTQAEGTDAGVLITQAGEQWRRFRMDRLVPYSAMILGGMIGLFVLYFLIRGRIRIEAGRSGERIPRFTRFQRWSHWYIATIFVTLAVTGLTLLYGRWVLIPLLGSEGFSITAQAAKLIHNFAGPLFIPAVILLFIIFERSSMFDHKVVMQWLKRAGGYLGGRHPHALKFNPGQKMWYWTAALGGVLLCASGLVLDFPVFGQTRNLLQTAYIVHTIVATGVLAFFVVHLYLGSIGMEGSLECMTTGYCDANWAKEQHDLWHQCMRQHMDALGPDDTLKACDRCKGCGEKMDFDP